MFIALFLVNPLNLSFVPNSKRMRNGYGESDKREKKRKNGSMNGRKIRITRYNVRYKEIMTVGSIILYLREKGQKGSQKWIARWRCGNEEKRNQFWKTEETKCKICGTKLGTLEQIISHVTSVEG